MNGNKIQIELSAIDKNLARTLKGAETQIQGFAAVGKNLAASFASLGGAITGIVAGMASGKLVSVAREFDVLTAGLKTATGSAENAKVAFGALEQFAADTPYDLQQVTQGFLKLVNMGLDPSERALTSYGNTASSMGKSLNDMIEAVADAATGEFERLKEFGIKAKSEGDKVTFTFRGVSETIGKNAGEIEEYLLRLGENEFAGAMQDRMNTLDGALSNLGDSWDKLFRTIADQGLGDLIETMVRAATEALDWLSEKIKEVKSLWVQTMQAGAQTFGGFEMMAETTALNSTEAALKRIELARKGIAESEAEIARISGNGGAGGLSDQQGAAIDRLRGKISAYREELQRLDGQSSSSSTPASSGVSAPKAPQSVLGRFRVGGTGGTAASSGTTAKSAAAAERSLNAEIAAGLRFREAQAELNGDIFAKQIASLESERQRYITTWADKAKTAEEKEQRITEITAWYTAARGEIEKEAAKKAADERRAMLESGVALKEAELARAQADGTITASEALREQVGLLRERQEILAEHLATMPKSTADEITAYNAQAAALENINAKLAEQGALLRMTDGWEAVKQGLREFSDTAITTGRDIKQATENAMASMTDALTEFVTTGKLSFSDLANSIIADMARIAIQQSVTGPLASGLSGILGGLFGGSSVAGSTTSANFTASSIFANASGGAYRSVGLSAYSNSIVNRPTLFKFASGIGLMGEAGAEAILPLKRGASGNLGVEASGLGANVVVNVVESPGKGGQQQQRSDNSVNVVDVFVEQIKASIAGDIAAGGGQIPGALQSVYGLNRATGGY